MTLMLAANSDTAGQKNSKILSTHSALCFFMPFTCTEAAAKDVIDIKRLFRMHERGCREGKKGFRIAG
jgi:hypothetical protein